MQSVIYHNSLLSAVIFHSITNMGTIFLQLGSRILIYYKVVVNKHIYIYRSTPPACIEGEQLSKLITRVQDAGTEVVKAKAGKGSATLSMAYAASRLTFSMLRALDGEANIVESAYVLSDVVPEVKYFATPLVLGKCGIEKNLGLGKLSDAEQKMVCEALEPLKKEIAKGEKFVQDQKCGGKKK